MACQEELSTLDLISVAFGFLLISVLFLTFVDGINATIRYLGLWLKSSERKVSVLFCPQVMKLFISPWPTSATE